MTKRAFRLGDAASGHDRCPPTTAIESSGDVFIEGLGVVRQDDSCGAHGCQRHSTHDRAVSGGSGSVFINGRPAARVGDAIDCGGAAAAGSSTVGIGD
ncbi:PAAR domain-containing protein [Roseobacter weihaiensis]|uniref:PAAR domain-containing protein n=1 Tax=Roseobacter weihaiensis TaxID=2763262 RepID=UPI001D0B0817|nr:PAAR domain-containing protein [Roseobacter sp. H9]